VLSVWDSAAAVANGSAAPCTSAQSLMAAISAAVTSVARRAAPPCWGLIVGRREYRLNSAGLRDLAIRLGLAPGKKKTITPAIERASSAFCRGVLRGLFDTDGSVQGSQTKGVSIRLAQSDRPMLEAAQRMLLRLGIAGVIYQRRSAGSSVLPDGRGGHATYPTLPQH